MMVLVLLLLLLVLPLQAQEPSPTPPAGPGHVLYVDSKDEKAVLQGLRAWGGRNPALRGSAAVTYPARGWIGVAVQALEGQEPEKAALSSRALSKELHTGVLHLVITDDGRAWYFYSVDGKELDRYCSNPGLPTEVSTEVLRAWAGKPDVLLPIAKGRPLSATRTEVSLTDFNALLYYYYPEMKIKKPATWRSPADFMRLLVQVLGPPYAPAPFAALVGQPGWKRL